MTPLSVLVCDGLLFKRWLDISIDLFCALRLTGCVHVSDCLCVFFSPFKMSTPFPTVASIGVKKQGLAGGNALIKISVSHVSHRSASVLCVHACVCVCVCQLSHTSFFPLLFICFPLCLCACRCLAAVARVWYPIVAVFVNVTQDSQMQGAIVNAGGQREWIGQLDSSR